MDCNSTAKVRRSLPVDVLGQTIPEFYLLLIVSEFALETSICLLTKWFNMTPAKYGNVCKRVS